MTDMKDRLRGARFTFSMEQAQAANCVVGFRTKPGQPRARAGARRVPCEVCGHDVWLGERTPKKPTCCVDCFCQANGMTTTAFIATFYPELTGRAPPGAVAG